MEIRSQRWLRLARDEEPIRIERGTSRERGARVSSSAKKRPHGGRDGDKG